jgi:hypothetical protein
MPGSCSIAQSFLWTTQRYLPYCPTVEFSMVRPIALQLYRWMLGTVVEVLSRNSVVFQNIYRVPHVCNGSIIP